MTLEELLDAAREVLDDRVEPYLFATADLVRHYNDAVMEACIRTRVLQDAESPLCSIPLVPGQATYTLDPAIFAVRRVRIEGQFDPLQLLDVSQLDREFRGWDDPTLAQRGTPRAACFDYGTGRMTLAPTPSQPGTVRMLVWRGPTADQRLAGDDLDGEPAIPEHMHRELKHWVAGQSLLNQDAEQLNPELAATHLVQFEHAYGRKPSLHEIRLWSTNKRTRIRAHFD